MDVICFLKKNYVSIMLVNCADVEICCGRARWIVNSLPDLHNSSYHTQPHSVIVEYELLLE